VEPLRHGAKQFNTALIFPWFLAFLPHLEDITLSRLGRFQLDINALGNIGGVSADLPGLGEVRGEAHLAVEVFSGLAFEPDNSTGLDFNEGMICNG